MDGDRPGELEGKLFVASYLELLASDVLDLFPCRALDRYSVLESVELHIDVLFAGILYPSEITIHESVFLDVLREHDATLLLELEFYRSDSILRIEVALYVGSVTELITLETVILGSIILIDHIIGRHEVYCLRVTNSGIELREYR